MYGKGGLSSLNSRLYIVRRMMSHLAMNSVCKLVDGLFTSKIRYGLQLIGKVRMNSEDPECSILKDIQLVQNRLLRLLNRSQIKDKISNKSMLKKFNMRSVNQINAQVKLLEVWKALNVEDYPLKINQQEIPENGVVTRASLKGRPIEVGKSNLTKNTSTSDAIRIWNQAPIAVTESITIKQAKKAIKEYAESLPI